MQDRCVFSRIHSDLADVLSSIIFHNNHLNIYSAKISPELIESGNSPGRISRH
jgi:hypothetical protein